MIRLRASYSPSIELFADIPSNITWTVMVYGLYPSQMVNPFYFGREITAQPESEVAFAAPSPSNTRTPRMFSATDAYTGANRT